MSKTFYSWLLQFENDNTAIGDLSRDVRCDGEFPRRANSYRHLKTISKASMRMMLQ